MAPAAVSPPGYLPVPVYMSTNYTGGLLIGAFFSTALTGVLAHMSWAYYERYPKDRRVFKWTVGFLLFVNLLHSAFVCTYEYQNLIDGFGNIATLTDLKWGLTGSFVLSAVAGSVVEVFYAYRVHALLRRSFIVPSIICIFAVLAVVFSIYLSVRLSQIYITFPTPWLVEAVNWLYGVTFALPAAADLLIVGGMIWGLLRTHKLELPDSSWRSIRKVIFYAIETNTVTTTLFLVSIAMFATAHRPIAFAIGFCVPKITSITLVSSLLARRVTAGEYAFDDTTVVISSTTVPRRPSVGATYSNAARQVRVATTTQTVIEKDGVLELLEQDGQQRRSRGSVPIILPTPHSPSSTIEKRGTSMDEDAHALSYV